MNRKERRNLIQRNKHMASKCPQCGKQSLFATDSDLNIKCVLCGSIVSKNKAKEQCFVKFK